jgi:hypothetical protein
MARRGVRALEANASIQIRHRRRNEEKEMAVTEYEKYERPPRITDEANAIERLLILLAVDNGTDFTSSLSRKSGLSTRQVNRLLRKSGRVSVKRSPMSKDVGDNDYWCQLTSKPKLVLEWPTIPGVKISPGTMWDAFDKAGYTS